MSGGCVPTSGDVVVYNSVLTSGSQIHGADPFLLLRNTCMDERVLNPFDGVKSRRFELMGSRNI